MGASSKRAAESGPTKVRLDEEVPDKDLVGASAILWLASLVRIAGGLIGHETFGSELTAAFLVVVFLPLVLRDSLRRLLLHRRQGRESQRHAGA